MYRICKNSETGTIVNMVQRLLDNAVIPFDPANTDYQEFLRWCEQGNVPLPAEE